jgi:hypothetical protein
VSGRDDGDEGDEGDNININTLFMSYTPLPLLPHLLPLPTPRSSVRLSVA